MRVGFIGLGNLGDPIARRLIQAGLDPVVFDRHEPARRKLAAAGARVAGSCADVAAQSDVIGVCVRDDGDVRDVMLGPDGVVGAARAGTVVALHSTILPDTVQAVARAATARGIDVIDATVSGGRMGAEEGTLTYMVGGEDGPIERCLPVLRASASSIIRTGPLGSGAAAKLSLSIITYLGFLATFEGMLLAQQAGLAPTTFEEMLRSGGGMTDQVRAFVRTRREADARADDEALQALLRNFTDLAEKDLALALAFARERGVALPGAGLCQQVMARVYGVRDEQRR